jgi:DNA-binding PadR family transcriptional regulator
MSENKDFDLSHVAFVVLGLISEEPCHGKIIDEKIENRGMREWTSIGTSSIYGVLKKLEKDGLVESWIEELDNRMIKVYNITTFGSEVLNMKIKQVLQDFYGKNDEDFYVAFSMFPILSFEEQMKVFNHSLNKIKKHKQGLEEMLEDNKQFPINVTGLFKHPIMILETDIKFLEWVMGELKKIGKQIGSDDYKK